MTCTITSRMVGDAQVLTFDGDIDTAAAEQIMPNIMDSLAAGATKVILDLAKVNYVASRGLGVFVTVIKGFPGKVVFAAAKPYVAQTLKISGFDKLGQMCKTVDEALAS